MLYCLHLRLLLSLFDTRCFCCLFVKCLNQRVDFLQVSTGTLSSDWVEAISDQLNIVLSPMQKYISKSPLLFEVILFNKDCIIR